MQTRETLSVVTITLNEAHCLEQCYRSIEWADEWVVVDSGSDDGTIELARQLSAKVQPRPFDNFSNQKNYGVAQATGDWVLVLDADEVVSVGLRREIEAVLRSANGPSCYAMPRKNLHFGRWLRYGGQYPDWRLRLFRKGSARLVGLIQEGLHDDASDELIRQAMDQVRQLIIKIIVTPEGHREPPRLEIVGELAAMLEDENASRTKGGPMVAGACNSRSRTSISVRFPAA